MKRYMNGVLLAFAAFALALLPSVATAAEDVPFQGVIDSFTYVGSHGNGGIFDITGTATVVGNFSGENGVHFYQGFTWVVGYLNITARNGDSVYIDFVQAGSFASGLWEGTFTINGGTGRYINATGGGTFVTTSDDAGAPLSACLKGAISY